MTDFRGGSCRDAVLSSHDQVTLSTRVVKRGELCELCSLLSFLPLYLLLRLLLSVWIINSHHGLILPAVLLR